MQEALKIGQADGHEDEGLVVTDVYQKVLKLKERESK